MGATSLFKNHSGQFSEVAAGLPPLYGGSSSWGDFDNDGDLDILVCGTNPAGDGKTLLYKNNNGIFILEDVGFTGLATGEAIWLDYNNDGFLDVLITGDSSYNAPLTKLYRNNGSSSFSWIPTNLVNAEQSFVAAGDYDNDGDVDILLAGECACDSGYVTRLYRNDAGVFTDTGIPFLGIGYGDGIFIDYDKDGDLDFFQIGATTQSDYVVKLYRNEGNGQFTDIPNTMEGEWAGHIDATDINNDGFTDLGITGSLCCGDALTALYLNDGNGNFSAIPGTFPEIYYSQINFGDYDNDGDADFVLTGIPPDGPGTTYAGLFRNQANSNTYSNNTPPVTPDGLTEEVNDGIVTFHWNKSTDNTTPSDGLTYNLRVGRSAETMEIMAPLSDLSTGYHKVFTQGNCGQMNSHFLKGLPDGTYYWSVQALDAGGAASAFAPAASFRVGPVSTVSAGTDDSPSITYNPTTHSIEISCKKEGSDGSFRIFDPSGREVYNGKIRGARNEIPVGSFRTGLYLFLFQHGTTCVEKKILIY
jgi:hypothetical protein